MNQPVIFTPRETAQWETNLWVVVTPGFTYGPFLTQEPAAGTPVAKWCTSVVRLATEADMAAIDAQDDELDEMERRRTEQ